MQIGDTLTRAPTFYGTKDMIDASPRPCVVVYIHPELRFYVVEFRSTVTGETWRETFLFSEPAGADRALWMGTPPAGGQRMKGQDI